VTPSAICRGKFLRVPTAASIHGPGIGFVWRTAHLYGGNFIGSLGEVPRVMNLKPSRSGRRPQPQVFSDGVCGLRVCSLHGWQAKLSTRFPFSEAGKCQPRLGMTGFWARTIRLRLHTGTKGSISRVPPFTGQQIVTGTSSTLMCCKYVGASHLWPYGFLVGAGPQITVLSQTGSGPPSRPTIVLLVDRTGITAISLFQDQPPSVV